MALEHGNRWNQSDKGIPLPIARLTRTALVRLHYLRKLLPAAFFGPAVLACGQGQVNFNNSSRTLISTNAVHGGPALGPTQPYPGSGPPQFVFALFFAPSTVTAVTGVMDTNWTLVAYATNYTSQSGGRVVGGAPVVPAPFAAGATANFLVRGWSASIGGLDWSTVEAFMVQFETDPNAVGTPGQLFGTSTIATVMGLAPDQPLAPIFGLTPGATVQGFLLDQVPTPEPSGLSLLALGGLLLAHNRHWRKC